jgi:hypothetical protein
LAAATGASSAMAPASAPRRTMERAESGLAADWPADCRGDAFEAGVLGVASPRAACFEGLRTDGFTRAIADFVLDIRSAP